jgi:hypothetical protein
MAKQHPFTKVPKAMRLFESDRTLLKHIAKMPDPDTPKFGIRLQAIRSNIAESNGRPCSDQEAFAVIKDALDFLADPEAVTQPVIKRGIIPL